MLTEVGIRKYMEYVYGRIVVGEIGIIGAAKVYCE